MMDEQLTWYEQAIVAVYDNLTCSECRDSDGPCDCTGYHARVAIKEISAEVRRLRTENVTYAKFAADAASPIEVKTLRAILSARDGESTVEATRRILADTLATVWASGDWFAKSEFHRKRAEAAETRVRELEKLNSYATRYTFTGPKGTWNVFRKFVDGDKQWCVSREEGLGGSEPLTIDAALTEAKCRAFGDKK